MRFISNTLTFLVLLSLLTLSCKKKSKSDTDPTNNSNQQNINTEPACVMASDTSYSTGYNNKDMYNYNANGSISSIDFAGNSSSGSITYTYDGNGTLLKRDQGSGTYTTYEFTSGKLSKYTLYISNAITYYTTVEYQTGKTIAKQYNPSDQLLMLQENTVSNDNITAAKYTYYTVSTGAVNYIFDYNFSNFDTKYSSNYIAQKSDKSLVFVSKNNALNSGYTLTSYTSSGTVNSTSTSASASTFSYNTSGAPTQVITSTVVNSGTSSTVTQKYTYTGCN